MPEVVFSQRINSWLKSKGPKTFGDLEGLFSEKSFAVAFLILMAPAALPLPTGGITHVFEVITMLLALEMIAGRRRIWTPKFWQKRNLGNILQKTALPKLIGLVGWFEKHSQKRLSGTLNNVWFLRIIGLLVFAFALASAMAIPFSGLDTLPALGIVLISLSLILEDALILVYATAIGTAGIIVEVLFGSAVLHFLHF